MDDDLERMLNDVITGKDVFEEEQEVFEVKEVEPVMVPDENTKLVGVHYKGKDGDFGGRVYTYYTNMDLKEGDKVKCPTRYTDMTGKVVKLDVPESEIEAFKDKVKFIKEYFVEEATLVEEKVEEVTVD